MRHKSGHPEGKRQIIELQNNHVYWAKNASCKKIACPGPFLLTPPAFSGNATGRPIANSRWCCCCPLPLLSLVLQSLARTFSTGACGSRGWKDHGDTLFTSGPARWKAVHRWGGQHWLIGRSFKDGGNDNTFGHHRQYNWRYWPGLRNLFLLAK